jgi:ABC-type Fe3+ transport system permease subunit
MNLEKSFRLKLRNPLSNRSGLLAALPAILIVGVCSGLPLLWIAGAVLFASPAVRAELHLNSFRIQLLIRTFEYNGLAAVFATLMGLPAAFVLGRGRGIFAKLMWVVLPAALLMPSLSFAYGWSQAARLLRIFLTDHFGIAFVQRFGLTFMPAGPADTFRCIWSLAGWLWAVPAGLIGLSLRRLDSSVQQQALLDGALLRVTLRQLLPTILASIAVVTIIATQEFAVYEPTGISVIATEVRMVFDTGAVSSPDNPIAGPVLQGLGTKSPDQSARAAAAVATALPLVVVTFLIALAIAWIASKSDSGESVTTSSWPPVLNATWTSKLATLALLALNLGIPVWALIFSLRELNELGVSGVVYKMWRAFEPQVLGAIFVASVTATLAAIAGFSAATKHRRWLLALTGATFLIGGQLLAIADIRIYNRPGLTWAYDYFPAPVFAYFGRFGWLAILASAATWTKPWRELRDMSSVDGASVFQSALKVVFPLAWPVLLAGGLIVGALSMTEVPATVLLFPQNPQVLTPTLMTWVHMAHYDSMIEASLLMMAAVLLPAIGAVLLTALGLHLTSRFTASRMQRESINRDAFYRQ